MKHQDTADVVNQPRSKRYSQFLPQEFLSPSLGIRFVVVFIRLARWGWAGLAVAVAGGLAHALRPTAARRRPDPLALGSESALARWESRRARRDA